MDRLNRQAIHCVVGAQFGSEAKGHVTAQVIKRLIDEVDITDIHIHGLAMVNNVRVGGPNAGHSARDYISGRKWALRTIPIGAVVSPDVNLVIAAGSEVDLDVLHHEISELESAGISVIHRLFIDKYATVLDIEHIETETGSNLNARTGSTSKGIGAARADRIMRSARIMRDIANDLNAWFPDGGPTVCDTSIMLHHTKLPIVIEGTQGYGLGLHTDHYPQTTSGDCRSIDLCAQAGITPTVARPIHTWLVARTYPIRVAGNSGALRDELTWEALNSRNNHIGPEYTTVTKKLRRVGEWDAELVRAAIRANGGTGDHLSLCLMFADYIAQELYQIDRYDFVDASQVAALANYEADMGQACRIYGTSDSTVIWGY